MTGQRGSRTSRLSQPPSGLFRKHRPGPLGTTLARAYTVTSRHLARLVVSTGGCRSLATGTTLWGQIPTQKAFACLLWTADEVTTHP